MKRITQVYLQTIDDARLTQQKAADSGEVDLRTLQNYLYEKSSSTPKFALGLSKATNHPEITHIYCHEECPIGQAYSYIHLDAVNTDPISVLAKLQGELQELQDIYTYLFAVTVNKRSIKDFKEAEEKAFEDYIQELLDVEHNIQVFKIALARWVDITPFIQRHNQKCIDHGYVKKEKTALPQAV